jgi:hypothetical protein
MAHTTTYEPPDPNPVCLPNVKHATIYSGNWAGHVVNHSDFGNVHFTYAQSEWEQPSVPGNSNYTNWADAPTASFWVGTGNNNIIQAGADSIATSTPTYKFWDEDYPGPSVYEGPAVHASDDLFVYTIYNGDGTASYFMDNVTTGHYQLFTHSAPYNGYGTADFINERLGGHNLPNFTLSYVYNNSFGTPTQTWNLTSTNDKWVMTSNCASTGTVLSSPTAVDTSHGFTQYWQHSSPWTDTC